MKFLFFFAALVCGALLPLSFAPFDWWPLGMLSIGGWFWLLNQGHSTPAALGFAYGLGKFGAGVSWVYVSVHVYGQAAPPLAAFLVLLFAAGLALFTLAQGWLYGWVKSPSARNSGPARLLLRLAKGTKASTTLGVATLNPELVTTRLHPQTEGLDARPKRGALFDAWLFATLWVTFEWLLTWFLTGFPWLYAGYGHLQTSLANLMPLGGVSLASLGIVVSAVFLTVALTTRRAGLFRVGALVIAAMPWFVGMALTRVQWVTPMGERTAALVQGNVDQAVKWKRASRRPIVDRYLQLTEPHWGRDLILWPESAITLFEHQAQSLLKSLDERGEQSGTALVLGILRREVAPDGNRLVYNTALAVGEGEGRYLKRRLVPFGEYLPFAGLLRGLIDFFDLPMSNITPGPWRQPLLNVGAMKAALAICYEVAYPNLMRTGAAEADLLMTISNDTWFGRSIGPLQHLQIARARALENGRWLLRATNNGVTAIVDHQGQAQTLPQFDQGVLTGRFQLMAGRTPYNIFGDSWLVALCLCSLAWGGYRRRKAVA